MEIEDFDLLKKIGASRIPAVVFVTAHDQYAVNAVEAQALDYCFIHTSAQTGLRW